MLHNSASAPDKPFFTKRWLQTHLQPYAIQQKTVLFTPRPIKRLQALLKQPNVQQLNEDQELPFNILEKIHLIIEVALGSRTFKTLGNKTALSLLTTLLKELDHNKKIPTELPSEVWLEIIKCLPDAEVLKTRVICKLFNGLAFKLFVQKNKRINFFQPPTKKQITTCTNGSIQHQYSFARSGMMSMRSQIDKERGIARFVLWNAAGEQTALPDLKIFPGSHITSYAYTKNKRELLCCTDREQFMVWDIGNKTVKYDSWSPGTSFSQSALFTLNDGNFIVAPAHDGDEIELDHSQFGLYSGETYQLIQPFTFNERPDRVHKIVLSQDEQRLLLLNKRGTVHVCNSNCEEVDVLDLSRGYEYGEITDMALSKDNKTLFCSSSTVPGIQLWDMETHKRIGNIFPRCNKISSFSISYANPQPQVAIVSRERGSKKEEVNIYNMNNAHCLYSFPNLGVRPEVAFNSEGNSLFIVDDDGIFLHTFPELTVESQLLPQEEQAIKHGM